MFSLVFTGCKPTSQPADKDKVRLDKICDSFMQLFMEGQAHNAVLLIKKNTILSSAMIDTLQITVDNQINSYLPTYGKMRSYELVVERKIKDFLSKRFYILRFDNYYLKFEFTLYKTTSGWKITGFKYDEDLTELLY